MQRCRPLEGAIEKLRTRCSHAPESVGEVEIAGCEWVGQVREVSAHLAESCEWEALPCPNAAEGCQESLLRKDAALHASETCAYKTSPCAHCGARFRALAEHEGICPDAKIACPNAGCGVAVARGGIEAHRGVCGREQVACPSPGCEERMARAEVEQHVAASGAVHLQRAGKWAAETEEKSCARVAEMLEQMVAQVKPQTPNPNPTPQTTNPDPYTLRRGARLRGRISRPQSRQSRSRSGTR